MSFCESCAVADLCSREGEHSNENLPFKNISQPNDCAPKPSFSFNLCDEVVAGHSVGGSLKKMIFQTVIVFKKLHEKYVSYNLKIPS